MDLSVRGILKMWCAIVAVPLGAGFACISISQNPEVGSSYTLKSWQNQPGKTDQTDHRPVHEGSLMVCTNVEPKKDGNECLLKYENDGKMNVRFHQAITATSTDEVSLSCVSKEPTEPVSCEATITVLKYKNMREIVSPGSMMRETPLQRAFAHLRPHCFGTTTGAPICRYLSK
jgi:hypothetical protein